MVLKKAMTKIHIRLMLIVGFTMLVMMQESANTVISIIQKMKMCKTKKIKYTKLELKLAELLFLAVDELFEQGCHKKAIFLIKEVGKFNNKKNKNID